MDFNYYNTIDNTIEYIYNCVYYHLCWFKQISQTQMLVFLFFMHYMIMFVSTNNIGYKISNSLLGVDLKQEGSTSYATYLLTLKFPFTSVHIESNYLMLFLFEETW